MKTGTGICLGASTVSFVKAGLNPCGTLSILDTCSITHYGDPKGIFEKNIKIFAEKGTPVVVTGRKFRELVNFPDISEPVATETALMYLIGEETKYNAIASLGGETFVVYPLDSHNRIKGVITGNKCASGTGEFFLQQIKRMNLSLDQAVEKGRNSEPFKVSGRCSVFCKSDCTHALNKGIPIGEVTAGLSHMIAEKVGELLRKVKQERILVIGGVTLNPIVMEFLKDKIQFIEIPGYAHCFEAAGAAFYGLLHQSIPVFSSYEHIFSKKESSFNFLPPLSTYEHMVEFKKMKTGKVIPGDECILGLDVGSTTTKAVVMRSSDNAILGSVYLRTNGNPIKASRECYDRLNKQLPAQIDITGLGITGSGRQIAGLHGLTKGIINEIVAHATAASWFDPRVDTLFEIGGQDAKYTHIINKIPADYAMNEACSAGTGSFLEEAASESLHVDVTDIAEIAINAKHPPNFNDQCAAFISSDIKTAFQENCKQEDVLAGLIYSICMNYLNRVKGSRRTGRKIFMQGGVCYNKTVPIAMAALTGKKIIVPPEPGLMGAFGAAIDVKNKISIGILKKKRFSLEELTHRDATYITPFICNGVKEDCDRRCRINLIAIGKKTYPFGGACNKYYNIRFNTSPVVEKNDYVKIRQDLLYKAYTQGRKITSGAKRVGISQSFHTNTIYPLYYNFFTELGFEVVLADDIETEGRDRELASFCYPVQLSLGMFQNLLEKKCDYYFIPMIQEMFVQEAAHHRTNFNSCCVFVSGEPYIIKQAFKDDLINGTIISPVLDFAHGFECQEKEFTQIATLMGVTDKIIVKKAYRSAITAQQLYQTEMKHLADDFLHRLQKNKTEFGMVLFGRSYNAFNKFAHKGIPRKFASRGIPVIPYDALRFEEEIVSDHMYWEAGKKILKAAQIVKRHPQLFGVYITNFVCAPDSMIIPQFRELMETKPSLTLELDGHTADTGINTRIDAAIDIIRNYRRISHTIKNADDSNYKPAFFKIHENKNYFITSDGESIPLTDPRIVVVIPSMGEITTRLFAAGFRSLGINAFAMDEATMETLKKGRKYTSGKECLPFILCVGHLFTYIEDIWDKKQCIAFFVNESGGPCRLGQYNVLIKQIIKRKRLRNVTTLSLSNEDAYAGLGTRFTMMAWEMITLGDVLSDIRSAILTNAVEPEQGMKIFNDEFSKLLISAEKGTGKIYKPLKTMAGRLKREIPVTRKIKDSRFIAMCGEVYVRRDGFSHKWLHKWFAKKGFIIKEAYVSEFILYLEWLIKKGLLEPHRSLGSAIEMFVRQFYMGYVERKIKKILSYSGFYCFERTRIEPLMKHSEHILPAEHKGETGLTIGCGMYDSIEKITGIINIGPFGCMPTRLTEGLMTPEMTIKNKKEIRRKHNKNYDLPDYFTNTMMIPFLSIESDGNVYPQVIESRLETFLLQAERMSVLVERYRNER